MRPPPLPAGRQPVTVGISIPGPARPAVKLLKSALPSSASATWRTFPPFARRTVTVVADLGLKSGHGHARQFAITATSYQRALNEDAEILRACVDDASAIVGAEVADERGVCFAERLHFAPRVVAPDMALVEGVIERSFEDG